MQPIYGYHDETSTSHRTLVRDLRNQGFRPYALSVAGDPTDPRYSALWMRENGLPWLDFQDVVLRDYQNTVDGLQQHGYAQSIVTSTGEGDRTLFAGVFELGGPVRFARHGLWFGAEGTPGTVLAVMKQARDGGYVPRSVDVSGTVDAPQVAGVWKLDPATLWSWHWDNHETHQRRLVAEALGGQYPSQVAIGAGGWYLSVFREGRLGGWEAPCDLTYQQYSDAYHRYVDGGGLPIFLHSGGGADGRRFSTTLAFARESLPKTWRVEGPDIPAPETLDPVVAAVMARYGIRAASIAIARDGSKYLTRAYTRAEDDFAATRPSTVFRIASLSKMFTAAAIQLLADERVIDLDQSVFGYLRMIPATPHDTSHDSMTIRHCATEQSGLPRSFEAGVGFRALGQGLGHMATVVELAAHAYTLPLLFTPGMRPNPFPPDEGYSNSAYYVLEAVIEQATGQRVLDFVNTRLARPLGIRDLYAGRTDIGQRLPGEVPTYDAAGAEASQLYLGADMLSPAAYGGQLLIDSAPGSGGFVTSAATIARFMGLHAVWDLGRRVVAGRVGNFAGTHGTATSLATGWDHVVLLNRDTDKGANEIAAAIGAYLAGLKKVGLGTVLTPFDVDENFPVRGVLLAGRWCDQRTLTTMGYDDMRNALIVALTSLSNQTDYQRYDNATLAGTGAVLAFLRQIGARDDQTLRQLSADDQRNIAIVEIGAQTGLGNQLQGLSNLDLVQVALGSDLAVRGRVPGAVGSWIRGILLVGGFRTHNELNAMSQQDMRNTLIVELAAHSTETGLQAYDDARLEGAGAVMVLLRGTGIRSNADLRTMSADDQRNVLIVELAEQTGFGSELQGLSNLELVATALGVRPVLA